MADPAILASGMSLLRSEWDRGVPVKYQMTFELALALAEEGRAGIVPVEPKREPLELDSHRAVSRKSGKAQEPTTKDQIINVRKLRLQLKLQEESRLQAVRETAERAALIAFSRKGGMSRKRDSLSYLIFRLVRVNRGITLQGLLHELKSPRWKCIIISIDGSSDVLHDARMIHYEDYGHRPKTASFTGLKDRLSRAKSKINSR
jgi:hypothetical protein